MVIVCYCSFSCVVIELGVSVLVLSYVLKGLEIWFGVCLFNCMIKSVIFMVVGEELVQFVFQFFDIIEGVFELFNWYCNIFIGCICINVVVEVVNFLFVLVMFVFMDCYFDIEIDIVVSNCMVDVIDVGFDVGICYGGIVLEDMVVWCLFVDICWVIVVFFDYLECYGMFEYLDDLLYYCCISNCFGDDWVYCWEFV